MTIELRQPDREVAAGAHYGYSLADSHTRLLLAEPDPATAAQFMAAADHMGIRTDWCRDGAETLLAVGAEVPTVLILAAHTDNVDAARVVATIRSRSEVPILVGAAKSGDERIVREVLAAGASAVVARPYDITTIAPFAGITTLSPAEDSVVTAGPIRVNPSGYETRVGNREVQLTQRELELLVYLIKRRGHVASQSEISLAVWGHSAETNTVAVHVKRLREKLGSDAQHGQFIRTIRGAGYRLAPSLCA